ncbi:M23 family metallopeptidase [Mesonia sp. K7]|uniref:M23 family metallopeptidase n=1 Tax=Mesonia sp. K7 TaxID=2218606 RepID=UPI000DA8A893|nr:M23 family metallopeptidase [Mesonia sp. K7]PZD77231.1 M23 family peptidase [Mesonia sp. K7]
MKLYILSLFLLLSSISYGQAPLPQDYFDSPLEIPLILSGTFGELRSNHFHSGLDIKTHQRTGLNVLASAEGYVNRIKISHYGYGKALYIQHPNGYSTVYAHLEKFSPTIEAYIKKVQYEKESYEVEVFPTAGELNVKQGELIAYSGNSGGSGGPHLHFEIRDSSARPINPFEFGIDVSDSRHPDILGVYVYPQDGGSHVNKNSGFQSVNLRHLGDHVYKAEPLKAYGKIGFGIATSDRLDNAVNRNGVYDIETFLNGKSLFHASFTRFSFAETRHLNQYIDYGYFQKHKRRIQKLYKKPNNPLSLLSASSEMGFMVIQDSLNYDYEIVVKDFKGNQSKIIIPIISEKLNDSEITSVETKTTPYFVQAGQAAVFDEAGYDIYIPQNALYEDTYLDIRKEGNGIVVHNDETPLHTNITIGFDVSMYSEEDKERLYIARMSDWGTPYYTDTYKLKNRFTTKTRTFGKYELHSDTTKPTIKPVNFREKQWMSNHSSLVFEIDDKETGIKNYRATINGKFILMEYDYKTNRLVHYFSDNVISDTENNLKIIVLDNVGNSSTFEGTFYRKNLN